MDKEPQANRKVLLTRGFALTWLHGSVSRSWLLSEIILATCGWAERIRSFLDGDDGDGDGEKLCRSIVKETSKLRLYGSWVDSFKSLCAGTSGTPYFKECLPDAMHAYMRTESDALLALFHF